jgi:hypothetical protein
VALFLADDSSFVTGIDYSLTAAGPDRLDQLIENIFTRDSR